MTLHITQKDQSVAARIAALRTRHAVLDAQLTDEQRRAAPDAARIRSLKRRKLRLKDEMSRHARTILPGTLIEREV
jgi:Uncharacterized small protein